MTEAPPPKASRFHPEKLSLNATTGGFIVDLIMVALVIINLLLILFDWLFTSSTVQSALGQVAPGFVSFYRDTIHADFIFYDMLFVSVYLTEFSIRWAIAAWRGTYHRWFFYPFVHWYDLLGCIPVGGFRWLRILRVISILIRLQRMGIVELQNTVPGRFVIKYYRVVIEEVSDRVVINVLEGVQRETVDGSPLFHRIETRVLSPRKAELIDLLIDKIQLTSRETYAANRTQLKHYLRNLSDEVIRTSSAGASLAAIPVAGPRIVHGLDKQLSALLLTIFDQIAEDIADIESKGALDQLINDLIDKASTQDPRLQQLVKHLLIDVIEEVKTQVSMQQWKIEEAHEGHSHG